MGGDQGGRSGAARPDDERVAELGPGRELHRGPVAQHRHRQHQITVVHLHRTVLLPVLIGVVRVAAVGAVGVEVTSDVVEVGVVVMLLEAFGVIQVAATAAASGSYLKLALEFDVLPHAQAVVRLVAEVHRRIVLN